MTTYALVLPAITLTRDTAGQQDGIVLEERVDAEQIEAASGNDGQLSAGQTEITEEGAEQTGPVPDEGNDAAVLTGTIYPESLDLRSEKSVDADVVESIPGGTPVTVLEDPGDGWLLISTPEGQSGYVKAAYVLLPGETVEEKRPEMTFELIADRNAPDAEIDEAYINGTFPGPVRVRVEAPVGALPAGTTMIVRPVAEEQIREAVESVIPGLEDIGRMSAVEFFFTDVCGDEIEPEAEIRVFLSPTDISADLVPHVIFLSDDGQARKIESKREENTVEETKEENIVFKTDKSSVYIVVGMQVSDENVNLIETTFVDPAQPEVSVSGMLPEGGSVRVSSVEGTVFAELESEIRRSVREQDRTILFVADSVYDIAIYDEQGSLFEPEEYDQTVTVSVEKEDAQEGSKYLIAHEAIDGGFEEPIRVEVDNGKIEYEAEHFSKIIDGTEYYEFSGLTVRPASETAYVGGTFDLTVDFSMEDLSHANFYGEIPYNKDLVDYSGAKGKVILDGQEAGSYKVKIDNEKAYLCISLAPDYAQGSAGNGSFSMEVKAFGEGELQYGNTVITIKDPEEEKYDNLSITKGVDRQGPVTSGDHKGDFFVNYRIVFRNNGNETVEGLSVYDIPVSFDADKKTAPYRFYVQENGKYVQKVASLAYPDTIPGDGNDYTMNRGSGSPISEETRKQNYYYCTDVSVDAGQELVWTYTVYLSAEDAELLDEANRTGTWKNYAGFRNEKNEGKEVSKDVSYTPDSKPMKKVGSTESDGESIEWTVSLETNGYRDASGSYISDRLKEDMVGEGLRFITDEPDRQPCVYFFMNGSRQAEKHGLTWEKTENANALESGDPDRIYYDDSGHFRWFSPSLEDANYGFELHYWTTFKEEWMSQGSINQAASNFSDRTISGIDGEYEADISLVKKLLLYDENNRSADWEITVPVYLTDPATNISLRDYLPTAIRSPREDNLRDTMDYMDQIRIGDVPGGNLIFTQDPAAIITNKKHESFRTALRYWEFDSVAEFEQFTGIHIDVTGSGTADEVLCGSGKIGFYTSVYLYENSGKPAGGMWWIYPNAVTASNTSITTSGMRNLTSTFPAGDYSIRFTYQTTTPAGAEKDESNVNYVYLYGTTALGNSFSMNARASYYMYPTDGARETVSKRIAKVERKEDGKIYITYMVLADNRSNRYTASSIRNTNTYIDALSGLPEGAAKLVIPDANVRDGVRVYKIPVTYDPADPTGWSLQEANSPEELEDPENGYLLITDPLTNRNGYSREWWGGVTREYMNENGFNLYVPFSYNITKAFESNHTERTWGMRAFHHVFDLAPDLTINWEDYGKDITNFYNDVDFSKMTKSSFYFVYTVAVDETELSEANVLRNTITAYGGPSGLPVGSSYQDYAVLLNELRKTITEKPSAANNFTVSYQLDVNMTETLKNLDSFTITDKLSDNLELDVQSLEVCKVNADGSLMQIPSSDGSGVHYTSMYTDHSLVIAMNSGDSEWADQYMVRYKAYLTDYEGRVHYENEAIIPDGTGIPHITEGDVYIKRPEGEVTNLKVDIYKYDGNNTSHSLAGAVFKLLKLSEEKRRELKELTDSSGITQAEIDAYLAGLSDDDWILFDSEKATGADGKAAFGTYQDGTGEYHSILFNKVYKLQETAPPSGYSAAQMKSQYFMFYTTKYPSYQNVEGIQNFIRSFVPETASLLIPNYKTSFRIYKTDAENTGRELSGARFELFSDARCTEHIRGYAYPNGEPAVDGVYYPDIPVPAESVVQYYLKEIQAPENYLLAADRVFVVSVSAEGKLNFTEKVMENGTLRDLNADEKAALIRGTDIAITITNEPNETLFEFNKQWLLMGQTQEWPEEVKEITVTLTRTCKPEQGDAVTQSVTFTVTPQMKSAVDLKKTDGSKIAGTVKQVSTADNIYSYRITGLEEIAFGSAQGSGGEKWEYSISEAAVDGYSTPRYIKKGDTQAAGGAASVGDGGTIQNEKTEVVLPHTGGSGTVLYTLGGIAFIMASALMHCFRMRRRERR